MPAPIPEAIKSRVIDQWTAGQSRDSIARGNSLGMGTVTNIVREYEDRLGRDLIRSSREIGVMLKREGLTLAQCAIGYRIVKISADHGVDEEAVEYFLSDVYKECDRLGIEPTNFVSHIEDLSNFSKGIRLPEIEEYLNKKIAQKKELDEEIQRLNANVTLMKARKSDLVRELDMISEQSKRVEEGMKSYFNFKQELESYGISMTDDLHKFARTIRTIAENGYEPKMLIEEFNGVQFYQNNLRFLKIEIGKAQKDLEYLNAQNSSLLQEVRLYSKELAIYNELYKMGFDTEKLKRLHDTIGNIAESNQIDKWDAIDKFFNDIDTQYDAKLGFEREKDMLIAKIQELKEEQKKQSESLREQPFIGPIIAELLKRGLSEDDILASGKLLLKMSEDPSSAKVFALVMIDTMKEKVAGRMRTASNYKTIEILEKAREELTKLD